MIRWYLSTQGSLLDQSWRRGKRKSIYGVAAKLVMHILTCQFIYLTRTQEVKWMRLPRSTLTEHHMMTALIVCPTVSQIYTPCYSVHLHYPCISICPPLLSPSLCSPDEHVCLPHQVFNLYHPCITVHSMQASPLRPVWRWWWESDIPATAPPATCYRPPATFHLPPATLHLPHATLHQPTTSLHLPPTTHRPSPTTRHLPPATYHILPSKYCLPHAPGHTTPGAW